jgi:hypothetical protein
MIVPAYFLLLSYSRLSRRASRAAWWPPIPCTAAPGGVAAAHRYTPGGEALAVEVDDAGPAQSVVGNGCGLPRRAPGR